MSDTDTTVYFYHSPSIPMTQKHNNSTHHQFVRTSFLRQTQVPQRPGQEDILDTHANSETSALFYIAIVLVVYVLALLVLIFKYFRTEQRDNRLTRLYDEFMNKDWYMYRMSKDEPSKTESLDKTLEEQKVSLMVEPTDKTEFAV